VTLSDLIDRLDELRQQCPASETAEIVGLPADIEIFYERGMVVVGFEVKVKEQPPVPGVH
jgi:hypothetical protein